ncbi:hypothetical protein LPW11_13680 [Geomonas sp. RF6]|uniref:hypothetical protein n=1 Tax=Geomonas sp. RF6 TaxID=2897342 RepID=UPI001E643E9C|nr:hypothetical protein [Geomonas sp. RF6]UFS68945.1 hypothetical protein LPW11_13680 [Geomonas sp. RF6]
MRRMVLLAAFSFVFATGPTAFGQVVAPDEGGMQQPRDGAIEEMDSSRQKACNCCQECQAAMKTTKGKEEGPPKTNGCRDCCKRCGKKVPMDKSVPPEITR